MKKILVVDDEPFILDICRKILEKKGFAVLTAPAGNKALEIIKENSHIDLLITDLKLPEINGIELARIFKDQNPSAAALVISGYISEETQAQARNAGVDGFLLKPFIYSDVIKAVNDVLAGK